MRGRSQFSKGQQDAIRAAREAGAAKIEFDLPKGGKMTVVFPQDEEDEAKDTERWNKLTQKARGVE
jgi:hypothetical protein